MHPATYFRGMQEPWKRNGGRAWRRNLRQEKQLTLGKVEVRGWFGRDQNGDYTEDEGSLQYLVRPASNDVTFDLTLSHPDDQPRQNGTSYEHMFTWIMRHSKDPEGKSVKPDAEFVCKRSALKNILVTCGLKFEKRNYIFHATKLKGTIYFKVIQLSGDYDDTPRPAVPVETPARQREIDMVKAANMKYAAKFEHYMFTGPDAEVPDPNRPIKKFCNTACVYRSTLGRHTMMYAGEVDGIPSKDALDNLSEAEFVELKIMSIGVKERMKNYGWKLLLVWPQCVLSGFHSVIIGRSKSNIVTHLEEKTTAQIPEIAMGTWDSGRCLSFLDSVLDHLKHHVTEGMTASFEWRHDNPRVFSAFDTTRLSDEDATILPLFYRHWIEQLTG